MRKLLKLNEDNISFEIIGYDDNGKFHVKSSIPISDNHWDWAYNFKIAKTIKQYVTDNYKTDKKLENVLNNYMEMNKQEIDDYYNLFDIHKPEDMYNLAKDTEFKWDLVDSENKHISG